MRYVRRDAHLCIDVNLKSDRPNLLSAIVNLTTAERSPQPMPVARQSLQRGNPPQRAASSTGGDEVRDSATPARDWLPLKKGAIENRLQHSLSEIG
ncbi:hypothetical protein [Scytonema millei]|uniref:Uncharacterized protein n=1 Tax=Scytonema millei VB511283 TaxID=1245923 RepID=A0A9X5E2C6_9CYAN|nr:hypothetical protein [Scytonema millei]NHC34025.1 hypothetical protein [Scytonema millei VB511283]